MMWQVSYNYPVYIAPNILAPTGRSTHVSEQFLKQMYIGHPSQKLLIPSHAPTVDALISGDG